MLFYFFSIFSDKDKNFVEFLWREVEPRRVTDLVYNIPLHLPDRAESGGWLVGFTYRFCLDNFSGSYDERKYGGEDGRYQQIQQISVTTSRPQYRPTVPTIITQSASNEDGVVITNPSSKFVPGYRYPANLENQKTYLAPVVNTLIQEVTPSTVNKYLPPNKRKANEDRPSKINGKLVPNRSRKPEYKKKENKDNKS